MSSASAPGMISFNWRNEVESRLPAEFGRHQVANANRSKNSLRVPGRKRTCGLGQRVFHRLRQCATNVFPN